MLSSYPGSRFIQSVLLNIGIYFDREAGNLLGHRATTTPLTENVSYFFYIFLFVTIEILGERPIFSPMYSSWEWRDIILQFYIFYLWTGQLCYVLIAQVSWVIGITVP